MESKAADVAFALQTWTYIRLARPAMRATTVLSVDGGGTRGLIPAIVLVEVEKAIKRYIQGTWRPTDTDGAELTVATVTAQSDYRFSPDQVWGEQEFRDSVDDNGLMTTLRQLKMAYLDRLNITNFHIRLADYFDMCAGTSTGAIVSTYLATDGKKSLRLLYNVASGGALAFPGSAAALVAMFQVGCLLLACLRWRERPGCHEQRG